MHPRQPERAHDPRRPVLIPLYEELVAGVHDVGRHVGELARAWREQKHERLISPTVQGQTDASTGNLVLPLYQVPDGFTFKAERVVVEDATSTPAAPYSSGTAWIALYRANGPSVPFRPGSLLDFGPTTAGGGILPCVFTDGGNSAPLVYGGEWLLVNLVAGPTNRLIYARAQGTLEPVG